MKSIIVTVLVMIVLGVGVGLAVMYSGMYNISATSEHTSLGLWVIQTTKDASIKRHAAGISPEGLDDSALVRAGYEHFEHSCVDCHGAPGIGNKEFAKGLYPTAPSLSDEAGEWSDGELFWIIKHGIKMTGMPAFGDTHSDEDIKAMTAFVRKLPNMGYYDYLNYGEGGSSEDGDGHSHDSNQHEH